MNEDNVIRFQGSDSEVEDSPTDRLRRGAGKLPVEAVEAEADSFVCRLTELRDESGRRQAVRNDCLRGREVQTGIGSAAVKAPRARDLSGSGIRFQPSVPPPFPRRPKSLEEPIPRLCLKGGSTGDFSGSPRFLLGIDAPGLSASAVCLGKRGLPGENLVRFRVDAIQRRARIEEATNCLPVTIGADEAKCPRGALPAFHGSPAEHWLHLRVAKPIESTFAAARLPAAQGCADKGVQSVPVRREETEAFEGRRKAGEVMRAIGFQDGEEVTEKTARRLKGDRMPRLRQAARPQHLRTAPLQVPSEPSTAVSRTRGRVAVNRRRRAPPLSGGTEKRPPDQIKCTDPRP